MMGKKWWDRERQEAYAWFDYRCWACGVHKSKAMFHQWLEAHESYVIDYENGWVVLEEIVALCHSCHNFIHSGRMSEMVKKGKMNVGKVKFILRRGGLILLENNLKPFWHTGKMILEMTDLDAPVEWAIPPEPSPNQKPLKWSDWNMIIEGVIYPARFNSMAEWQAHWDDVD